MAKLLTFVETDVFRKKIDRIASLETLFAIQRDLLESPDRGSLVIGSGGIRKARVAPPSSGKGKSGGLRYLYLHLEKQGVIYLLYVFAKSEMENLSKEDLKEIREMVRRIKTGHRRK